MHYKGVIFDFNGVLLLDSPFHEKAWNKMSIKLRGKPFIQEEIETKVHGRITKDTLSYLVGRNLTKEESKELDDEKEQMYIQMCIDNIQDYQLSEGSISLLDYLVENNIAHTIATASPKVLLEFYEKHLHLSKWFDLNNVVYNDFTFPGKPSPDIFLRAAEKINLDPKDCIVIEDARSGILAAKEAEIGYIIALGPEETHTTLRKVTGVNEVITDLSEFNRELLNI
ncbi:MAG: HAD family phosphatase [Candidatus Levybacteria bacterium]|nr:HAD family phosphatase [Candidatus Levybacteria bacterium]